MSTNITHQIEQLKQSTNSTLEQLFDNLSDNQLHKALRYTCLTAGKRFRPLLTYFTGLSFGAHESTMDYPAAALEMIHNYTLIHDDLPSMDDDDLRHGQPTCHRQFGEATAILTGDALLAYAFEIITSDQTSLSARQQVAIIQEMARACGPQGITLGQHLDMNPEDSRSLSQVETIHYHKTATLIQASIVVGALCGKESLDPQTLKALRQCGEKLGLAYQIQDDVLDLVASSEHLGKATQKDAQHDKHTYSALAGIDKASDNAQTLYTEACNILQDCGLKDSPLSQLIEHFSKRDQ